MSDQDNAVTGWLSDKVQVETIIDAALDGLSESTRRLYRGSIDQFLDWLSQRASQTVNKGTLAAYKHHLEKELELAPSTVNRHLSGVRKFIHEAFDYDMLDKSALAAIKYLEPIKKPKARRGNWLTQDQAVALLEAPDPNTRKGARDRAILAVLLKCGLRREEVVRLTYDHKRRHGDYWVFEDLIGKGDRKRTVRIPLGCKRAIDRWTEVSGRHPLPSDRIFVRVGKSGRVEGDSMTGQGIYYLVQGYCKDAGIPVVTPDDLRRTFARVAYSSGTSLEHLQLLLGHVSLETTARYVDVRLGAGDAVVDHTSLGPVGQQVAASAISKKRASEDFDVFLCHSDEDKPVIRGIGKRLKERGILPWLDEWEQRPGVPWGRALEEQIESVKSAAVFVGKNGIGPWQDMERAAFLQEFVRRGCPVIPVILADCDEVPELPVFLRNMTWVDFRRRDPNPMERLIWGITGERPSTPTLFE